LTVGTTKRDRKAKMQQGNQQQKLHLELAKVSPLTENQQRTFDFYDEGYNLLLTGSAGTGKTFIAMYLALEELLQEKKYKKIVIIRSIVPSRDTGFLPGSIKEKAAIYEMPYKAICSELFRRDDAYEILRQKFVLEFETTSFLRGTTFRDSIVIVDEIQNFNDQEINTTITRMGENSKVICCGDFRQIDLTKRGDESGIRSFIKIVDRMEDFAAVEFNTSDIVRSDLVKQYLIAKQEIEDEYLNA
jgi:phosphate starvation-inducible PhoH-like protein